MEFTNLKMFWMTIVFHTYMDKIKFKYQWQYIKNTTASEIFYMYTNTISILSEVNVFLFQVKAGVKSKRILQAGFNTTDKEIKKASILLIFEKAD